MFQIYKDGQPISEPKATSIEAIKECVKLDLTFFANGVSWFVDGVEIRPVEPKTSIKETKK